MTDVHMGEDEWAAEELDQIIERARLRAAQADVGPEDYLTLAVLLGERAEDSDDCAEITEAIGYARSAADGLDGEAGAFARYVLGAGHLARAGIGGNPDDLPAAAAYLREASGGLEGDDRLAADARLGLALAQWVVGDQEVRRTAELDEAVRLLGRARQELLASDPLLPWVRFWLAMALANRFTRHAAGQPDAQDALAEFEAVLAQPGLGTAMADCCHFFVAFLLIYGSAPASLRHEAGRFDPGEVGRVLANGLERPPPDVARAAIGHLDQISASLATHAEYGRLVPWLRAVANLSLEDGERPEGDLWPQVEALEEALRLTPADDPAAGVWQGMLGLAHGMRARSAPGSGNSGRAVESLVAAVRNLGDDHPLLPILQGALGGALGIDMGGRQPTGPEATAAIELLESVLDEMPDDHPARSEALTRLGGLLIGHAFLPGSSVPRLQKLRGQLEAAVARPAASPANEALNQALLGMTEGIQGALAPAPDLVRDAVDRLQRAADMVPRDAPVGRLIRTGLIGLLSQLYLQQGELQYLDVAVDYSREIVQALGGDEASDPFLLTAELMLATGPAVRNPEQIDQERVRDLAARLEAVRDRIPEDHPLNQSLTGELRLLRVVSGGLARFGGDAGTDPPDPTAIAEAADAAVAIARATAADDPLYAMNLGTAGNARAMQGILSRDRRTTNEGFALLAEACAADTLPDHRWRLLCMLAMALRLRYDDNRRDRAALTGMISALDEARSLAPDEGGSGLAEILYMCGLGRYERDDRNLGDRRRAVAFGLDALRERSAAVLLQSTTDQAFDVALAAAGEASSVVRWCLAAGNPEAAIEALERGRGMVLHAATADASVASALRDAGHSELALEWELALAAAKAAGPDPRESLPDPAVFWSVRPGPAMSAAAGPEIRVPSDLRRRVITALAGTPLELLLAPPSATEIAGALTTAGARALIYLLAREGTDSGLALVVDDKGQVREIRLPGLAILPRGPAAAFAEAQRDAAGGSGTDDEGFARWRRALAHLSDWAWTAAMDEVLESVGVGPGSAVQVVLVPVGDLGLVPWHAARRLVADGRLRYACQDATFSYAASARQYTEACRNGRRSWRSEPALVRLPESDLYFAAKEAQEIHRRYYPGGILLGGDDNPALAASPENVRALLPRPEAGGVSLLHLGCHAVLAPRPVDAKLVLEGGETLGMREILRQARDRPRGSPGCLVVLAACGSDLAYGHHDEALTLATSFLAAGATGILGARWPVDDLPTLAFMSMFHHYLNSGYDTPSIALRHAQAWMLNPDRIFPEVFRPKIAEMARAIDLAGPEHWAAFTYQGL